VNGISRAGSDYTLSLDTRIYSILAIKKTAYKFADRVSIVLRPEEGSKLLVAFNFCDTQEKNDPEKVISDFCNELIDQDLRDIIKKETEPVKNLILAHAFSKTKLVDGNS